LDIFIEKIIKRKKTIIDYLIIAGIIIAGLFLAMIILSLKFLNSFMPLLFAGIIYLAYIFIKGRNIEYEYIVTNGDLDIDMIIAQRKRKRLFSANCKDFEVMAKKSSSMFNQNVQSIKKVLNAATSLDSPDVYFATLVKDNEKMVVFFEPNEKILNSFKKYNPRNVFTE
jgi:hypothetical protein